MNTQTQERVSRRQPKNPNLSALNIDEDAKFYNEVEEMFALPAQICGAAFLVVIVALLVWGH